MASTDLYTQAAALLVACQTLLAVDTPSLSYLAPGTPAIDCEMLTVHAPGVGEAPTGPAVGALDAGHRGKFGQVTLSSLLVTVTRCDAQPAFEDTPDPVAKAQVAERVLKDVWILWNGLYRLIETDGLFFGCGEKYLDPAQAIQPQGGMVGWTIPIRLSIPGYNPI